jgi:uncharacterized protein (DUF433 family)
MTLTLDNHLDQTAGVRGGRPCLLGTRITVDDVVIMHRHLGQSLDEIAGVYDLSLAALHAAMTYYFDHQAEVDRQIEADDAYVESRRQSSPSKLQAKLKALRGG